MKVLVLNGSPRKNGTIEKILKRTICSASQVCKIEDLVLQLHSQ